MKSSKRNLKQSPRTSGPSAVILGSTAEHAGARGDKATRKLRLFLIISILLFGAVLGATINSGWLAAHTDPGVVASVDGRQIPAAIYRMYLKNGIDALGLDEKSPDGRHQVEQLKEGIISELIDRYLIEAEVNKRKLALSQEMLAESYQQAVARLGGPEAYQAYLFEHGLTDKEFRQTTLLEVCGRVMRAELTREVSVAESDIEEFYNNEKDNPTLAGFFKAPERVRASHILIAARQSRITREIQSRGVSPAEVEQLTTLEMAKQRNRAVFLLKRLKRGAAFQQLASQNSDDPATRDRGGDLGLFGRNTHTLRFDEAAFALKPGQVSDIVETEYGYHIILLTEHLPERVLTLSESRESIRQRLLAAREAAHLKTWLENRRREADIRIAAAQSR